MDNHWVLQQSIVLLRPMLVFVDGEDITGAMGHVSRRRHIGEEDEAARRFLQASNALGVGVKVRLQVLAHGLHGARLLSARPAPTLHGLCFHRHLYPVVGRADRAERRRRRFRIGAAAIHVRLSGPGSPLDGTIGGRDVPDQPLLPPCVLGAGVDHHRARRRPVERDCALRDFRGRHRTVRGRLGVGEDANGLPGVVRYGLGDEPPALALGGREACDEQGVPEGGQIGLGHPRGIGHGDRGAWCHPMLGQEGRNVR
jgi:hypothetical protein